jgi:acetyl-CoA carboxylase biotin carboxyl carrier protein
MIDLDFIEGLIRAIDQSGLDSIEIERGGTRIRMAKTPVGGAFQASTPAQPMVVAASAPVPPPAVTPAAEPPPASPRTLPEGQPTEEPEAPAPDAHLVEVASPMVGTFYRAPAPDAPPYVETGSRVAKGDTLCIIEAMKLMNELECEVAGTIAEILVENAEPVEYGQPLFRIDPT